MRKTSLGQQLVTITKYLFVFFAFAFITFTVAAEPQSCSSLSELQCIKSSECTLNLVERNKYICAPDRGRCEVGFIQWGNNKVQSCESKRGCKYVPGNCYCQPDVICRCGGGEPPKCIEVKAL